MIRKTVTKFIALLMCGAILALVAPWSGLIAKADNEEVRLDPFTGLPVDENPLSYDDANQSRKQISGNMYYDYNYGCFVYLVGNGLYEITSNVADGMIVNEAVVISAPAEILLIVYQDGNEIPFDGSEIRSTGEYTVMASVDGNVKTVMSFTIVGAATGKIVGFTIPDGFYIKSATCEGQNVPMTSSYISMSEEGQYSIQYACEKTDLNYFLNVRIDHTPPQVTLEGVKEDGKARGPVTITGLEESDRIAVYKDGEMLKAVSNKLTQSGRYEVTVTDNAENSATYNFTIMIYLDINGVVFFLVIALVIGAVVAYILIQRKHLKVR